MKYIYLYSLVVGFIGALITGLYMSKPVNIDPIISEVRAEKQKQYALGIINTIREDETSTSVIHSLNWNEFKELAYNIAKEYDIPPSVMIAQAALESGRGTSYLAKIKHNYFGLGAYDTTTGFGFKSEEESIRYYARLISKNTRYQEAYKLRSNPKEMIIKIWEAGYASSPDYVNKVLSMPEFKSYL